MSYWMQWHLHFHTYPHCKDNTIHPVYPGKDCICGSRWINSTPNRRGNILPTYTFAYKQRMTPDESKLIRSLDGASAHEAAKPGGKSSKHYCAPNLRGRVRTYISENTKSLLCQSSFSPSPNIFAKSYVLYPANGATPARKIFRICRPRRWGRGGPAFRTIHRTYARLIIFAVYRRGARDHFAIWILHFVRLCWCCCWCCCCFLWSTLLALPFYGRDHPLHVLARLFGAIDVAPLTHAPDCVRLAELYYASLPILETMLNFVMAMGIN